MTTDAIGDRTFCFQFNKLKMYGFSLHTNNPHCHILCCSTCLILGKHTENKVLTCQLIKLTGTAFSYRYLITQVRAYHIQCYNK